MRDRMVVRALRREYTVEFVDDGLRALASALRGNGFLVGDEKLRELYAERLAPIVPPERSLFLPANEQTKSFEVCGNVLEALVDRRVRRDHRIVALGGGVIQDVAGFVASVLYRGVEWTFIPTTLLAQADSCIGSKTSLNLGQKKNLVGTFHPPSKVFIDTAFLESLSVADIRSGIGEIMHFYLYADSPLAAELVAECHRVVADRSRLLRHIRASLEIKRRVVELDEFDAAERRKFNYGHTFGHALETATGFAVNHGQAVTVGMDLANGLSVRLGLMSPDVHARVHELLRVNFPELQVSGVDWDAYFQALGADKKNVDNQVTCILAEAPGRLREERVPMDAAFQNWVRGYFESLFGGRGRSAAALAS